MDESKLAQMNALAKRINKLRRYDVILDQNIQALPGLDEPFPVEIDEQSGLPVRLIFRLLQEEHNAAFKERERLEAEFKQL